MGAKYKPNNGIIIAIGECSNGNSEVGDMWLETKIFNHDASLQEVISWANSINVSGRLILTVPKD